MPANNDPIFSRTPDIQWINDIVTANTTNDLTAGTSYLVFTADATNGGFISDVVFRPTPAGNTTATVARLWLNNGSTTGTAANNVLIAEVTLPAVTASGTLATAGYAAGLNRALPAGYRIYITIHTASANGWKATAYGGKY